MKSDCRNKMHCNCRKFTLGIKSSVFYKTSRLKAVTATIHFSMMIIGMICAEWLQNYCQALYWKLINTVQSIITRWKKSCKSCNYAIVIYIVRTTALPINRKLTVHLQSTKTAGSSFYKCGVFPHFRLSWCRFFITHSLCLVCRSDFMG